MIKIKIVIKVHIKKMFLNTSEILFEWSSTRVTSQLSVVKPNNGIAIASSSAMLTSIAILITKECVSKFKLQYAKLRDWIAVNNLLYEKAIKNLVR